MDLQYCWHPRPARSLVAESRLESRVIDCPRELLHPRHPTVDQDADRWQKSRVRQASSQYRQKSEPRSWESGNAGGVKFDHLYGAASIWKMGTPERSPSIYKENTSRGADDAARELYAALDRALNDRRVKDAVIMVQDLAAVKRVPSQKSFLRLISLLCREGGFVTARHLLKLFPDRSELRLDEHAYGTLVNCALRTGHLEDAEELLQAMLEDGYRPRVATWSSVVARLGRTARTAGRALDLFHQMCGLERSQASRPDSGACNAAINAAVTGGDLRGAEELLEFRMPELRVAADVIAYNILVKGYAMRGDREKMCGVVEKMKAAGVAPDEATYNTLVSAYVGMGDMPAGEAVMRGMRKPSVRTITVLINGYVEQQEVHKARMLLDSMESEFGFRPNEVAYTCVIKAYANLGQLEAAQKLLLEMADRRIPANVVTYNTLLSGYCRAGQWENATCLFKDMQEAEVAADVITYNTLIDGCIQREDNVGALDWFKEMRGCGVTASTQSYTNLIKLFGDNAQPWLAARVFEEMEGDVEVRLDRGVYNSLINSFSRAGLMEEAETVFRNMKAGGVTPNLPTYGTLVRGYRRQNLAPQCLVLWREIKERLQAGQVALQEEAQQPARWKKGRGEEPFEADEALLDDLVYVCVRAGYFQRALEIVRCMEDGGISADRLKYKRLFIELYSDLKEGGKEYVAGNSSHIDSATQAEFKSNKSVEAFKFWLGLPNHYYRGDWEWDWRDKPLNPSKRR